MNINSNRSNSHKEKRMNVITKATSVAVFVTLGLALTARAAEPATKTPAKSSAMGQEVKPKWIWHSPAPIATPVKDAKPVETCFRQRSWFPTWTG